MGKLRTQSVIDSNSSDSTADTNLESDLLSLARKRKKATNVTKSANSKSDSDSDWANKKSGVSASKKKRQKKASRDSSSSEGNWDDSQDEAAAPIEKLPEADEKKTENLSEQEEGEVSDSDYEDDKSKSTSSSGSGSDSSSFSSSSSDFEFDDGYDDDLMGDEEDRKRLNGLSEKERETEIFKRTEQRDIIRKRLLLTTHSANPNTLRSTNRHTQQKHPCRTRKKP